MAVAMASLPITIIIVVIIMIDIGLTIIMSVSLGHNAIHQFFKLTAIKPDTATLRAYINAHIVFGCFFHSTTAHRAVQYAHLNAPVVVVDVQPADESEPAAVAALGSGNRAACLST